MNKPINFKDYFQWEKHQQGKVSAQFSKELLGNDVLTWLKEAKSFCEINFHHYSKVHPDNSEIQTFLLLKSEEKNSKIIENWVYKLKFEKYRILRNQFSPRKCILIIQKYKHFLEWKMGKSFYNGMQTHWPCLTWTRWEFFWQR